MTLLTTERLLWHCGAHTAVPKIGDISPIPPIPYYHQNLLFSEARGRLPDTDSCLGKEGLPVVPSRHSDCSVPGSWVKVGVLPNPHNPLAVIGCMMPPPSTSLNQRVCDAIRCIARGRYPGQHGCPTCEHGRFDPKCTQFAPVCPQVSVARPGP